MDYGQPIQPASGGQAFFTAGVGTSAKNANTFEEENNLDTSSEGAASWKNPVERNPGDTGKNVLNSFGNTDPAKEELNPSIVEEPSKTLEQTQDLLMPPGTINPEILQPENQLSQERFNQAAIKTEEKLSKSGIKEVDDVLVKFRQDGNPASFYDAVRDMMKVNLKNSYNRELGV